MSKLTDLVLTGATFDTYITSAALSGTTPSVDVGARDTYTLTTSGNTTFTFRAFPRLVRSEHSVSSSRLVALTR